MPRKRDEDVVKRVGRRVAQARNAHGFTQEKLAEAVGIQPVTLSRLETGDRAMSLSTLAGVSAALGIRIGDLLGDERPLPTPKYGPDEAQLLRAFASLEDKQKKLMLGLARELSRTSQRKS